MVTWPTHKRKAAERAQRAKSLKKHNRKLRKRGIVLDA